MAQMKIQSVKSAQSVDNNFRTNSVIRWHQFSVLSIADLCARNIGDPNSLIPSEIGR